VPPADHELLVADHDAAPPGIHADLVDVGQRDQQRAVDPDEAGLAPLLLEGLRIRWLPVAVCRRA
jgi:hypothetical protein